MTFPKSCFEMKQVDQMQNNLGNGPPGLRESSVLSWDRMSIPGGDGVSSYFQGPNSHPDHPLTVAKKQ